MLIGGQMGLPVAASGGRAVLSELPRHDGLAVGAEGHGLSRPWWANGAPSGSPVATSQSRPHSRSPVTVLPSGLNATADNVLVRQGWAEGLAGRRVRAAPSYPSPRRDGLAVGAEGHGVTGPSCLEGGARACRSPRPTAAPSCPRSRWRRSCRRG